MRNTKSIVRYTLLCLLLASTGCSGGGVPSALTGRLKCGMSTRMAREIVAQSGATLITNNPVTPVSGTHTVALGRDRLWLMFASDRLQWIRSGRQVGWTGMHVGPKLDLCTGEQWISLIIHGDSRWSRAAVVVDGKLIGELSDGSTPGLQVDVPSRRCHVSVTKGSAEYSTVVGGDRVGRIQIDLPQT